MTRSVESPCFESLEELDRAVVLCRRCPRLVRYREGIGRRKRRAFRDWTYWAKPVPGFGDPRARVLVLGLAPAAHGANRTGRMFTGDASGNFLFTALHRAGFANQGTSVRRNDELELRQLRITAALRCAPPGNKPSPTELSRCQRFLDAEIALGHRIEVVVTLGRIAFDAYVGFLRRKGIPAGTPKPVFRHGAIYPPLADWPHTLVCSYHPSRQNTQTGRLTRAMFDRIWRTVHRLLTKNQSQSSRVCGHARA